MTNKLIGVLTRFCEQSTAFMADIESMFCQVRVSLGSKIIFNSYSGRMAITNRLWKSTKCLFTYLGQRHLPAALDSAYDTLLVILKACLIHPRSKLFERTLT